MSKVLFLQAAVLGVVGIASVSIAFYLLYRKNTRLVGIMVLFFFKSIILLPRAHRALISRPPYSRVYHLLLTHTRTQTLSHKHADTGTPIPHTRHATSHETFSAFCV